MWVFSHAWLHEVTFFNVVRNKLVVMTYSVIYNFVHVILLFAHNCTMISMNTISVADYMFFICRVTLTWDAYPTDVFRAICKEVTQL